MNECTVFTGYSTNVELKIVHLLMRGGGAQGGTP